MLSGGALAGMRPRHLNAGVERRRRSLQRIQRHRAYNISYARQPLRAE
jgi:hypothetical protein